MADDQQRLIDRVHQGVDGFRGHRGAAADDGDDALRERDEHVGADGDDDGSR